MRQSVVAILTLLITSAPTSAKDESFGSFSTQIWRSAPNQDPQNWSREPLLAGLPGLGQMRQIDRATIIAQLGPPGISDELYTPGAGRHARLDIYRLSAKNDRILRIDYDTKDRFEGDDVETGPCGCPACIAALPDTQAIVRMDILARAVLKRRNTNTTAITKGRLDQLVGHAGRPRLTTEQAGGQAWTDYSEIWRIAGPNERYFLASGQVPARDRATQQDSEFPITSYALVTVGPDCSSQ
jgi:hypothetical protein